MEDHRVNELIELLHPAWKQQPDLSLLQFLNQLAGECGFKDKLENLSDDALIYQLKMRDSASTDEIPGLKKDYEEDFKTALLRARGVIND
ncbi:YihD family protein [Rouxiella sp. WC2420]|uniref:YihD family protein n=1 Tax=Rouxiella sp. WC2420 TaxID=3234145 RepID=A0AB39VRC9_9GAMM